MLPGEIFRHPRVNAVHPLPLEFLQRLFRGHFCLPVPAVPSGVLSKGARNTLPAMPCRHGNAVAGGGGKFIIIVIIILTSSLPPGLYPLFPGQFFLLPGVHAVSIV